MGSTVQYGAWAAKPVMGDPQSRPRSTQPSAAPLPGLGPSVGSAGPGGGGALPYANGGGAGSAAGATGTSTTAPQLTLRANTNASLEALRSRYGKHLDDISGDTGHFMDLAGSRIRDAREGQRNALQQDSVFRGAASDPSLAAYDAETTGDVSKAVADVGAQREQQLTSALQGGVNVMGAPEDQAMREKQLQVSAYQAQNAANNQNFASWLALLNATRTSPIYTG
jgi:hypothetical protein